MLLKYFELVFFKLHLVKISCKLITIRLSYKRKKECLFMKHRADTENYPKNYS